MSGQIKIKREYQHEKNKKGIIGIFIWMSIFVSWGSATNSYATTNLTVTDFTGLQSAFTTANANTTEDYVVTINGTIQMTTPLSLTKAKLTLSGNGTILRPAQLFLQYSFYSEFPSL